ncbi:MAG: hypothetical protein VYA34_15585 [Myxococcota bacterium]|nr:hypothetical protein [Myxococcota bacterium]
MNVIKGPELKPSTTKSDKEVSLLSSTSPETAFPPKLKSATLRTESLSDPHPTHTNTLSYIRQAPLEKEFGSKSSPVKSTDGSFEIEAIRPDLDIKPEELYFFKYWEILDPKPPFSPDKIFEGNPVTVEIKRKNPPPDIPFRIKVPGPISGRDLKTEKLTRAAIIIDESYQSAGIKEFARIKCSPDSKTLTYTNVKLSTQPGHLGAALKATAAEKIVLKSDGMAEIENLKYTDPSLTAKTVTTDFFRTIPISPEGIEAAAKLNPEASSATTTSLGETLAHLIRGLKTETIVDTEATDSAVEKSYTALTNVRDELGTFFKNAKSHGVEWPETTKKEALEKAALNLCELEEERESNPILKTPSANFRSELKDLRKDMRDAATELKDDTWTKVLTHAHAGLSKAERKERIDILAERLGDAAFRRRILLNDKVDKARRTTGDPKIANILRPADVSLAKTNTAETHHVTTPDHKPATLKPLAPTNIIDRPIIIEASDVPSKTDAPKRNTRNLDQIFDFAEAKRKKRVEKPGYLAGVIRGTSYKPIFSTAKEKHQISKILAKGGNFILGEIGKEGSKLIHKEFGVEKEFPLTNDMALGFSVKGRKIRESDLLADDPRRIAIEKLRDKYPNSIPAWVEGNFGQDLSFKFGHDIPLGATGAMLNFGFSTDQSLNLKVNRLLYFRPDMKSMSDAKEQAKRLLLLPTKAKNINDMEIGATYKITGNANLRLDAGIGLGAKVPALDSFASAGATVEAGGFATLSGKFELEIQKPGEGRARIKLSTGKGAGAGVKLNVMAGVELDETAISKHFGEFVTHCSSGQSPGDFKGTLPDDMAEKINACFPGYMSTLAGKVAEGASQTALNEVTASYTSAALKCEKGFSVDQEWTTNIDFRTDSDDMVTLPRADMLPKDMRNGKRANQPVSVNVGRLSQLAYNMAVRGDMRLVQQLSTIRGSGVRLNEEKTKTTTTESDTFELNLPFAEYKNNSKKSSTIIDRFTPELGRTRLAIEAFNEDYKNFFGDTEEAEAKIKVHSPHDKLDTSLFLGADKNFSADLVVENHVENWTSFEEMQNYMGVLNSLSGGNLVKRCAQALAQGKFHDQDTRNDHEDWIRDIAEMKEFGRTTVHMHLWVGERGLRRIFAADLTEDDLYGAMGEAFRNVTSKSNGKIPEWSKPGSDRTLYKGVKPLRLLFGSCASYGVSDTEVDLATARYLVDNIMALRKNVNAADTPSKEEAVAKKIRDFLAETENKLPAFAALAMLVPEEDRAVEMRLTSIRKKKTPIRFTYIQDGRSAELLKATGFATTTMAQFKKFGSLLDLETRLRIGNLLKEINANLSAPSPDTYLLTRAMDSLNQELQTLDNAGQKAVDTIETDMGLARGVLSTVPDVETIQRVLPGGFGASLATIRMNALRQLAEESPNFTVLRATFKSLMDKMPIYRHVASSAQLLQNTANLANELHETEPELAQAAVEAIGKYRGALADLTESEEVTQKILSEILENVVAVNVQLQDAANQEIDFRTSLEMMDENTNSFEAVVNHTAERDFSGDRKKSADAMEAMVGNPKLAAVSYFERSGTVPKTFLPIGNTVLADGTITASMLTEAELAMASTNPSGELGIPKLTEKTANEMAAMIHNGDLEQFLAAAEKWRYRPEPMFDQPKVATIEALFVKLPKDKRDALIKALPKTRQGQVKNVLKDLDADAADGRPHKVRHEILALAPRYNEDLGFLLDIAQNHPKQFEASLVGLGYSRAVLDWTKNSTSRLDQVFSKIGGDTLQNLLGLSGAQKRFMGLQEGTRKIGNMISNKVDKDSVAEKQLIRLTNLIKSSDLRPQTRAKLAAQISDDAVFYRHNEKLVEAIVTGMNAADTRIFFDHLHKDGKIETFLSGGDPKWKWFLRILTFGLAFLWTYDNNAAKAIVAKQGWKTDEILGEYNTKLPMADRFGNDAERIMFNSITETIPVDPVVKSGMRAAHSVVGNVKFEDIGELPTEGRAIVIKVAEGAGKQLGHRLIDIAKQGGSPAEIATEYENFLKGLSPAAIKQEFQTGDNGSAKVISDALQEGAIKQLKSISEKNKWVTPEVLTAAGIE